MQIRDDLVKKLQSVLIDARDRLIEEQKVGHRVEREREKDTLQLTAREHAEAAVHQVCRVNALEVFEDLPAVLAPCGQPNRAIRQAGEKDVPDGHRGGYVKAQVLRHIADDGVAGVRALGIDVAKAPGMRHFAENRL